VLARLDDEWWRENHLAVPYFAGLQTGDTDALIGSFAGEPELHHPVRERIKGARAFAAFAVGDYHRALAARDIEAIMATFEPNSYVREPAGEDPIHRGPDGLRELYERLFLSEGGIVLEPCALVADARAYGFEYNVVRHSQTELLPEAGFAVYVGGESGKLEAARIYDDAELYV
jgi:SnoaL-like domain